MKPTKQVTRAKIIQDEEKPVERPVLATAIVEISRAMTKLLDGGLNERAVVCLVHDACGVGKPDIRAVLSSLKTLHRDFCR